MRIHIPLLQFAMDLCACVAVHVVVIVESSQLASRLACSFIHLIYPDKHLSPRTFIHTHEIDLKKILFFFKLVMRMMMIN